MQHTRERIVDTGHTFKDQIFLFVSNHTYVGRYCCVEVCVGCGVGSSDACVGRDNVNDTLVKRKPYTTGEIESIRINIGLHVHTHRINNTGNTSI
jgi:hypothetical protein